MGYEDMSVEELEATNQQLMAQKEELRKEQLALHAELDKKNAEAEALRQAETMTDTERAAMAKVLENVGGIDSGEEVAGAQ